MYSDTNVSSSSTMGGDVELVSRFLAPLCARDETARNIALAAARTTVEGWLGGVGSPNNWEEGNEMDDSAGTPGKFKGQDGRYDMNAERSPLKSSTSPKNVAIGESTRSQRQLLQLRDTINSFGTEGFFPQSVTENPTFFNDASLDRYTLASADLVDGRFGSDLLESDRRHRTTDGVVDKIGGNVVNVPNDTATDEKQQQQLQQLLLLHHRTWDGKSVCRVKGARQMTEDDELDSDTRIYGKSPKFDDDFGNCRKPAYPSGHYDLTSGNFVSRNEQFVANIDFQGPFDRKNLCLRPDNQPARIVVRDDLAFDDEARSLDGVVFNTLDGFENESNAVNVAAAAAAAAGGGGRRFGRTDDLENMNLTADGTQESCLVQFHPEVAAQERLQRNNADDRKFSVGQTKRPLSQDEDVGTKSGRILESSEVTPGDVGRMLNLGNALDGPRQAQANKYLSLVSLHLPVILRLSVNCPFQNVRIKCAEILEMVKDRGLSIPEAAFDGPSAFVPTSELPDLDSLDEKTHILLMDAFLQNNRLDHVSRVMASHPLYLEHFLRTQHFILRGDGPLPYDYRHLIAIMAAGRHQCSYLINLQKGEFLLQGGDPSWLQGLRSIPGKLQDLYEINKILAHRPWLLNKTHIEKLTKGADNWSLAEVVHAIVLLAHFHSLSSFVFSCGINEELDNVTGHQYNENVKENSNNVQPAKDKLSSSPQKIPNGGDKTDNNPSPPSSPSIVGEQEVGVETLMERMKRLSEKSESYQITQEELSKRFETVETQSAELAAAPQRSSVLDSDIGLFIEDPTFIYQDFAKRGQLNDIPTFRVQDYSWDDHGYSLVNRLYNDVGNLLDDKFKTAYNLTYYTMGTHNKVDTSRFRRAIWNYIQCMFGIRHDDYDYNEVNQLLERSLKTFIKSAVCYPERVTKRDYDRVMREFKHSEKVHVNLMILEARMQAELLYALRAVMRYMT